MMSVSPTDRRLNGLGAAVKRREDMHKMKTGQPRVRTLPLVM